MSSPSFSRPTATVFAPWLSGCLRHLLQPMPVAPRAASRRDDPPAIDAEPPGACGWFDSSHELVQGLQVQELTSPESLAAALPLSAWLQMQLDGCGAAQAA